MAFTNSPNMILPIPGVGTEAGPNYALDINASLTLIDSHDHSLGRGVQITPAGININTAFSLNSNNLTNVGGIQFTALGSLPTTTQFLYTSPGVESPLTEDLWYNDGNGAQIQITSGGLVNATIASLPGESYAGGTFTWVQIAPDLVGAPANFDIGSIILRPNVVGTANGVELSANPSAVSQYTVTFPTLLPSSNSFVTLDNSGNLTTTIPVANGITASNIANGTITSTQISPTASILGSQLSATANILPAQLNEGVWTWNTETFILATPSFSVRLASTANLSLSGTAAIDGVTPIAGDLILAKNQTSSNADGVYVAAAGAWSRSTSYNTFTQLNGASVHVIAGTLNSNTDWFQNNTLTSLSDPQSWLRTFTQTFVVPAGVNLLQVLAIGGGGSGGSFSAAEGGGGGGGGVGGNETLTVTPGETITISIGTGGITPGAATGVSGGNTVITSSTQTLTFLGGGGGGRGASNGDPSLSNPGIGGSNGGGGGASTGTGGDAGVTGNNGGGGGGSGLSGGTIPGLGGASMYSPTRAAGGALTANSQAGGGGGSGFAIGGAGGASAVSGSNAPTANSGAGGGGGGGTSGIGGRGAAGQAIISWLGRPS